MLTDCPRAAVTEESRELVKLFVASKTIAQISPSSLFGPDQSKWPAKAFDAWHILAIQDKLIESEMTKAATES